MQDPEMATIYNTTVFRNGRVIQWRMRDGDYNRFKVLLDEDLEEVISERYEIDSDDCGGDDFATIMRMANKVGFKVKISLT